MHAVLDFLDIPCKCSELAVEQTVLASVKALYFMHQVCFVGPGLWLSESRLDRHSSASDADTTDDEKLQTILQP